MYRNVYLLVCGIFIFLALCVVNVSHAQQPVGIPDGYATQNGGTTGGGNATPIHVTTAAEFRSAVGNSTPAVVVVHGRINLGGNVSIGSNKTIIGADTSAGLYGGRVGVGGTNYIFQNLTIGPADGDTFEVSGATNVFVYKCEFFGSTDELCSIVRQADFVTVAWSKFYFPNPDSHSFAHLIGNGDGVTADRGKLHVTLHHNWYAEGVRGRMPRVRFGHVHIYNNYYNSPGNGYCIGVGFECHIKVENTHFEGIRSAWADYGGTSNGEIGWSGLKFVNSSQPTFMPNAYPVYTLPYAYALDPVDDVKTLLTDPVYGAGNRLVKGLADDTQPPSPDPMTWSVEPYTTGASISMTAATASDPSGVEYYFANLTDPTHDSGWQVGATYVDSGLELQTTYSYTVRARDRSVNQNETAASGPASATTGDVAPVAVNFQPVESDIPAGYVPDYGDVYGDRGNGYVYGWNFDHTAQPRERNANADPSLDTIMHFSLGGAWEYAAANGEYDVEVTVGDPHFNSTHTINVEGESYWNALELGVDQFATLSKTVTVTDGRLSIDQGDGADKSTRICRVVVTPLAVQPEALVGPGHWLRY